MSERDGWNHVYVVSRDGKSIRLVTRGAFDVVEVLGTDEKGGWLYYLASPDNPTQRYLFRSRLDGKGAPERLSPPADSGTHAYDRRTQLPLCPGDLLQLRATAGSPAGQAARPRDHPDSGRQRRVAQPPGHTQERVSRVLQTPGGGWVQTAGLSDEARRRSTPPGSIRSSCTCTADPASPR